MRRNRAQLKRIRDCGAGQAIGKRFYMNHSERNAAEYATCHNTGKAHMHRDEDGPRVNGQDPKYRKVNQ